MKYSIQPTHLFLTFIVVLVLSSCSEQVQHEKTSTIEVAPIIDSAFSTENDEHYIGTLSLENHIYDPLFYIEGQLAQHVRKIYQDTKGNLWFGTNTYGIIKYNGDSLSYLKNNDKIGRITAITEDSSGNVWFGTASRLLKYDGTEFSTYSTNDGLLNDEIWCLKFDQKGTLWVGTNEGLCQFDGETFTDFPLPKATVKDTTTTYSYERITCIMEANNGTLWFGTDGFGICKYDGETFENITKKDGLPGNNINALLEDSKGNIWIGTSFGGVSRFHNGTYINFSKKGKVNGIEVSDIYEEDNGDIWFTLENKGVYKYDGKSFTNYYETEGLQSNAILCIFKDRENRFWFGGWGGLFRYDGFSFQSITKEGPWDI